MTQDERIIDESYAISAGKFRRYHSQSWLVRIFDVKTNILNLRDFFRVGKGYRQSKKLLAQLRPDIVFIKGGFVAVPVGRACAKLGIQYITHDSDAVPGLANRMIAKNAFLHTVGMPKEFYSYPPSKTEVVGIPLSEEYAEVTPRMKVEYRNKLKLPTKSPIIFVTGGSQGAQRLNYYVASIVEELLTTYPDLYIVHQVGKGNLGAYNVQMKGELQSRLVVREFIDDMVYCSGAADIVVTRAGATTIAELALQAKACVLVPNPYLTGGHQLQNAKLLAQDDAVEVIHEETLNKDPEALLIALRSLLEDKNKRTNLGRKLHNFAHPHAAQKLAEIILESVDYIHDHQKGSPS